MFKAKKYVSGASDGCDKYHRDILRKSIEKNEIYRDGKHYYNDDSPIGPKIFVLILLIIAIVILKLLGYTT